MKKCPNCGESNHDLQDICVSCGASFAKINDSYRNVYEHYERKEVINWTRIVAFISLLGFIANIVLFFISLVSPIIQLKFVYYLIILIANFLVVRMLFELADLVDHIK